MKLIFIMADTFRRDHIGAYGNKWINTPNLDRLAATSNVFDHAYIGSFPTLPNRRDIHLGHGDKDSPINKWRRIDDDEVTIADRLFDAGVYSMMVNDVANSVSASKGVSGNNAQMNFMKGFSCYATNRGQEADNMWGETNVPLDFPVDPKLIRYVAEGWRRVLINRAHRRVEDDWFAPGTYKIACEWLEHNYKRDDFMLWIETFDPHEPWDPPQHYIDRYDPGYKGRVFEAPTYGFYKKMGMTDREVRHIHARYSGECDMVDKCVGRLLATLERLGIEDEVGIIFTADHGAYFGLEGDNGLICKPNAVGADGMSMSAGRALKQPIRPLTQFTGVTRVPLIFHLPKQRKGKRFRQIVQPWDLTPTVLEMFGLQPDDDFYGQSLLNLVNGKKWKSSAVAVHGPSAQRAQAINKDWLYVSAREDRAPVLIDLKNNPAQNRNVAKKNPAVCKKMQKEIIKFFRGKPGVDDDFIKALDVL